MGTILQLQDLTHKAVSSISAISVPCRGNGMVLGLTDSVYTYGLEYAYYNTLSYGLQPERSWYGQSISATVVTPPAQWGPQGAKIGVSTDPNYSGIIADLSSINLPSRKLGNFYIRY